MIKSPEDHKWIKKAAQPAAGISDLKQKAPIAYYIVSRAGADAAARELAKRV